ncbi:MAG: RNA polymerase factor sigma-54 [Bdellovibrionales bacterium]|nr:RNA polymerase factor sigma-54 [Bdellovibrionales bacterium]
MALGMKQVLNLSQSLVMTPQLQQAIKLLQLSRMELENLVNTEMVENPMLEETPDSEGTTASLEELAAQENKAEENPQNAEDFDWASYLENFRSTPNLPVYRGGDEDLPTYENTLSEATSLHDHVLWQLNLSDLDDNQKLIGQAILGNINDDGYLQDSIEEIAQRENFDPHEVEAVLYRIQEMDPLGVGSRDLKECLLVQIYDLKEKDEILERIVENHLTDLEKKNYTAITKALGITMEEVVERVKIIQELEPKPGRAFGASNAHYIIPDIYVAKRNGEYVVMLNEDGLPKLKVSNFYKTLLDKNSAKADTKEYIRGKLRSAVWLIRSIHQRQRTIFKVTESIVKQQYDFFEKGIAFLKPMVLRDVANDIGMHESTISRVTTAKYVHTPRGIFELKFFFNSGINRVQGAAVASESVKEKVKAIISKEDPARPFSDQKIAEMLLKENIDIARRTVAKYREMLGILPSSKRKKVF